jgi:hypothetical protein
MSDSEKDLNHAERCVGEFVRSHLPQHEPAALALALGDAALKIVFVVGQVNGEDAETLKEAFFKAMEERWLEITVGGDNAKAKEWMH